MTRIEKIELVIKIPLEEYRLILLSDRTAMANCASKECMMYAIKNGSSLPKGHGRLFDERDIVDGSYEIIGNRIYELEPIIEADISGKENER